MNTPSRPVAWFLHALNNPTGREIAQELLDTGSESGLPVKPFINWVAPGQGWEDQTLNLVRKWSIEHSGGLVLYTHTKGAFNNWDTQKPWREAMTDRLVRAWPARIGDLQEHDTSGLWWLTPELLPACVSSPYYAGNFWWARASFLASLPELPELTEDTRFEAEAWIGRGNPKAKWMSREWPSFSVPS